MVRFGGPAVVNAEIVNAREALILIEASFKVAAVGAERCQQHGPHIMARHLDCIASGKRCATALGTAGRLGSHITEAGE